MRKFLINKFAGDFIVKLFSKVFIFPRAAIILAPLMTVTGAYLYFSNSYPTDTLVGMILFSIVILCLVISFIYFKIKPIKESDWLKLYDVQKWQFGKFKALTKSNEYEWDKIDAEMKIFYEEKSFSNVYSFILAFVLPILIVILLILKN